MTDPRNAAKDWVELQEHMTNPPKDATAQYGRYASLDGILNHVRPQLAKFGFAITQGVVSEHGSVGVTTQVRHISGEVYEFGPLYLPAGATAQTAGSAITYARRYQLCAALGIAAENDDDGASASKKTGGGAAREPSPSPARGAAGASSGDAAGSGGGEAPGPAAPKTAQEYERCPDCGEDDFTIDGLTEGQMRQGFVRCLNGTCERKYRRAA